MWVSKKKWSNLCEENSCLKDKNIEQENEISKLEAEIATQNVIIEKATSINNIKAKENGCKIGPWCAKCEFSEKMGAVFSYIVQQKSFLGYYMADTEYSSINEGYYCTKHIKDICPEFQNNKN